MNSSTPSDEGRENPLDAIAAVVVVLDRDGRVVSLNRAGERLTGWSAADVCGRFVWDIFIVPEEVDEVRSVFANLRAGAFPNEHENHWLTRSGARRWIAWSNTATVDARGDVELVIATGVDTSARKRIDDDLRYSEERFRILVDRVPDYAIFMLDAEGRVESWNAGAESITGHAADAIIGRDFAAHFTLEDVHGGKPRELLRAAADRGHVDDEGWRIRKDGTRFRATVSITALRDPGGGLRGFANVTRDETPRWRAEQRQRLFDQVSDVLGHALPDYDETLLAVARLAVQSFADFCTIARIDDQTIRRVAIVCSDVTKEPVAEAFRTFPMERTHTTIMPRVFETRRAELHTQSSYLEGSAKLDPAYVQLVKDLDPQSIIVAPILSRGRALGILSIARTRSGTYDEDDVRFAEELGERAGLHIDNAQLYRRAQQAVQARDDVMGIVAHDLRNPLNTIGLRTQQMLYAIDRAEDGKTLRDSVTKIQASIESMDRLISDLFDAARRDPGHLVQTIRACDPAALVTEAVENARALAESKELTLRSVIAADLPAVGADPERVHQVLANLLGNAIKFTPASGCITVTAEHNHRSVAFAVTDTGPGIAPEDLPRVFDRFWQGTRSDRRGAGLGLWICNGIVKSHGGALSVESTLGQGSKFWFTLPVGER